MNNRTQPSDVGDTTQAGQEGFTFESQPPSHPAPVAEDSSGSPARPWGPWATVGWCIILLVLENLIGIGVILTGAAVAAARGASKGRIGEFVGESASSGLMVSLILLLSVPVTFAVLVPIIRWRGWRTRDYLAVERIFPRQMMRWLGLTLAYLVLWDLVLILTGRELVAPWMVQTWRTAGSTLLLVIAFVGAAPFIEEILFRGFLYRGLAGSRIGPLGAILVATAAWSVLHLQYGASGILAIAGLGLLLGAARYVSGSVTLPMVMHAFTNALATLELVFWSS